MEIKEKLHKETLFHYLQDLEELKSSYIYSNINNGKLFIQRDGGNNYKEIEENWEQYKNQNLLSVDYIDYHNILNFLSSKIYDSH